MVVDRDGQYLFGLILADHILVEVIDNRARARNLPWLGLGSFGLRRCVANPSFTEDLRAQQHTFVADIGVIGTLDQPLDFIFGFATKGTAWFYHQFELFLPELLA